MGWFDKTPAGMLWGAGTKALSGIGDALKDKEVRPTPVEEPSYYPKLRETVGNRLQGLLDSGPEKYGGQLVAPLTDEQNKSLSRLNEFDAGGRPSLLGEGANEISKTLASQYDPATSAYFQAFRDQRLYDLGESKRRFNEDAGGGGRFFQGARVEGLRKMDESATRDINTENATLADRERQRRLDVLPQGINYAGAQTGYDLSRISALQDAGSLNQRQGQAEDTAAYNEYLRQLTQGRADLSQASQFAGETPYAYTQYQPSELMRLLQAIIPAAGQAAGAAGMAAGACHVAEVLYGEHDPRTHLARAYVAARQSEFLRAYRQYSRAWAAWLREHPASSKFFRPIWDAMVAAQMLGA